MGAKESGQSFIAGVLAKLPEADRAAAQAILSKPEAEAAVVLIGDGVLARTDYSKNMDAIKVKEDELAAKQQELSEWFAPNEAALKEYLVIKPEYEKLKADPNHKPNPAAPLTGLTKADLEKELATVIEQNNRAFAGALALATDLSARHSVMFGEALNTTELLGDPKLGRPVEGDPNRVYGLQDAYNTKHGARVTTKAQEAETARINKMVDEQVATKLRGMTQHPFPLRDPNPSPLDALTNADRKPDSYTVDSAVAEFDRLNQARVGA